MSTKTLTLTTAFAAALLSLGCTSQATTAKATVTPVDAAVVTITPEGSYIATLDLQPLYAHAYGFDYDNDGSYVGMYQYEQDPQYAPDTSRLKYPYAYDYDADGGHTDQHAFNSDPEYAPDVSDRKYPYGFDYDNDGSYTATHAFSSASWDPEQSAWRYAYKYDRNGNGSHAKQPELKPEPQAATVGEWLVVPFMLDAELVKACTDVEPTFYFAFDSAKLAEDVDRDLTNLVDCLQHELMSGAEIEVVGHADMRGTESYNEELGRDRAESVAQALREHGLSADRIETTSMGEAAADAPMHWDDRRVVIRLR